MTKERAMDSVKTDAKWKLVPELPTREMFIAAFDALVPAADAAACWGAMVAASPPAGAEVVGPEGPDAWLIRKGGYFYRPNCAGYTVNKADAGRYTEAEAKAEAAVEPWHMQAILADDVPGKPTPPTAEEIARRAREETASGHVEIAHDGFAGDIIGHYVTREGKRGVVVQQDDTRVVHVYGEKWLAALAKPPGETGAGQL
jgi:hypothetical protein